MATFLEIKQRCKILKGIREELIGIRDLFDEKTRDIISLKQDIKKGGIACKYRELELIEATQNMEFIRIEFEKKHREHVTIKTSISPNQILDLRYKEIKQKESELYESFKKVDKLREECEEMDITLEQVCKEYDVLKKEITLLNNYPISRPDYGNSLYKNNKECLKQISLLEDKIKEHRQLYELSYAEDQKKKEEINKEMAEFFQICEELEDEPELEEGVLL
jgi:hypothetical protein